MKLKPPAQGFTLVEVLLVILLIGLLAASVVMSFTGESRDKKLAKQTEQLQLLIQLASETAMLKQQELGLFLDDEGYRFMLFKDEKWHSIREPKALRSYKFAEGIEFELELEGLEWSEGNLLSQVEWQEEDKLFEENSFDEIDAAKERENQQQDSKDPNKKATAPLRTGFVTEPRKKGDPAQPQIFILSSGEITPFLLTLKENSESPGWKQQLKAVFSIPLERGEVEHDR